MVASVGRITAGRGYDYLTRDVATSKHDYYTGSGEAPGKWAGAGSALLGLSGEVDADDMASLYGRFVVPSTAGGTRLPSGRWEHEEILGRKVVAKPRADGTTAEPVAAFDVTFSPSKSVSLLWGLTDNEHVRASVVDAHEQAVSTALEYLAATAGHTRAGDGGIRKVAGNGFVIAQFRHRTARSTAPAERVGDPQLHSHCAILNRVQGVDGKWRTLDSRAVYRHAHAAGAIYAATLERQLSERLGVTWATPDRRVPMREIDGMPEHLLRQFSSRRSAVLATYEPLEEQWRQIHGRSPTRGERAEMMDEATVRSRQPKAGGNVDLHQQWRATITTEDVETLRRLTNPSSAACTGGGRLAAGSAELTERIFAELHQQRSWWTRAHVTAEIARLIANPDIKANELETERLIAQCVPLEVDDDPEYADLDAAKYTSEAIQDAERRVLTTARDDTASFAVETVGDPTLGADQVGAVTEIVGGSGRVATVIGPAGAGKTTMLRSVAASLERGNRAVAVLTLSAAAARVVTDETGLPANTIAAWRVRSIDMPRDGLVIVDEASMVPTLVLDELIAGTYRTKVALIGDYAQMGAPEAGGLLRDLAALPHSVELTAVRRFTNTWEADASTRLRTRHTDVADLYQRHRRIHATTTDTAFDDAAAAWWRDTKTGTHSLIVVDTANDAADLNTRCQTHLLVDGRLGAHVADAADGTRIHIGDQLQTRRNTTDIATSDHQRILNRDVWHVLVRHADGALLVQHTTRGARAVLPADYIAHDTVLAYATTIAGAQGRTVDNGHVVVTPRTTSASLYVGMTRGRHANHAHVITDNHDHYELRLGDRTPQQAFSAAVVRDADGQLSAHAVKTRWLATEADRTSKRNTDRRQQHIANWWGLRQQSLPSRAQHALASHGVAVCNALIPFANDRQREQAVVAAVSSVDWRKPEAADQFLDKLRASRPPNTATADAMARRDRMIADVRYQR